MWIIQSEVGLVRYFWVPNFGDAYVIGGDGSLWSRYQKVGMNWILSDDWTRLNLGLGQNGYRRAVLYFNGVSHYKNIHQLVCEAVHGPCPVGQEVCHNDNNKSNNDWRNLRYDTHPNNCADRIIHGTDQFGEKGPNARSTWVKIREIREKYASGKYSQRGLAREYGLARGTIQLIVNNQTWIEGNVA
jgi:hypothetical protein